VAAGRQVWCFSDDFLLSHWVLWKKKEENITVDLPGGIALSATLIMVCVTVSLMTVYKCLYKAFGPASWFDPSTNSLLRLC